VPLFEGHQQAEGLAVFTIAGQHLWLQVAQPLSQLRLAQTRAASQAGAAVMLVSVLAAAVLAWRVRSELQPVAQMAVEVEAIDPAPIVPGLPRSPRRELEPVYGALEGLLRRLAQKLRSERAFATHAAHSLRTPLAGLSAQIEVTRLRAPDELLPRLDLMQESARRLTGVVEALLTMTRASSPAQWRRFEAQTLARVALARRIEVDASRLADASALDGDPDLLSVAVSNLVDNAARHGAGRVRIGASRDPRMQCIEIADDGPGVTAERLGALRNGLARFDESGEIDPALGLGLTLAAAVARAHGGRVDLDCTRTPAPGFCARLCWPTVPPADSASSGSS
jgi:signal transduction histidine kinase